MEKIFKLSKKDKVQLFTITAEKFGITPESIEKDFWVVYWLDFLFNKSFYKDYFVFKGGTCLSKCYDIIHRFSEDIDIILLWEAIGIEKNDAMLLRNTHQSNKFIKNITLRETNFFKGKLIPEIINFNLKNGNKFKVELIEEKGNVHIRIYYPSVFNIVNFNNYIRLEIGSLSLNKPYQSMYISPYCAYYFKIPSIQVKAVIPEYIFWEKIFTIHKENLRLKIIPNRKSRHFYDLFYLFKNNILDSAIEQHELMEDILKINTLFYNNKDAKFKEILEKGFCLCPDKEHFLKFEEDFILTRNMFFEKDPISFKEIIDNLKIIEDKINFKLKK